MDGSINGGGHLDGGPEMFEAKNVSDLIAFNEAYREIVDTAIQKFEEAVMLNLERAAYIKDQKDLVKASEFMKRKIPVNQYMPPYFKDDCGMCPPMSAEAKAKLQLKWFDPLMKEDKKWTPAELKLLRGGVKDNLICQQVELLINRREIIAAKLKTADVNMMSVERRQLVTDLEEIMRKIAYFRNQKDEDVLLPATDYSKVRFDEIASTLFKGQRSGNALKAKWMNEQSPKWSKEPWTATEVETLKDLRESPEFVSWPLLALQLNTNRTAFQCFEKYKTDVVQISKEWTQDEDQKLIGLTKVLTINGVIQWDKVAQFMPGRSRQQVRTRFSHTLDSQVKHGRWTDQEDLLLICSVSRLGAKDWSKVALAVPGRNDSQCRERWVNVLNKPSNSDKFTAEEDEQLLYAVNVFGKGNWAKCAAFMKNKNCRQLRRRYVQLISTKLKVFFILINNENNEADAPAPPKILRVFNKLAEYAEYDDETCDDFLKRVNQATSTQRAGMAQRYAKLRRSEHWDTIEANLNEISAKHRSSTEEITSNDILRKLHITDNDVRYLLERGIRQKMFYRCRLNRRSQISVDRNIGGRLRPVKAPQDIALPQLTISMPEDEKVMLLVESLCNVVRKQDNFHWFQIYRRSLKVKVKTWAQCYLSRVLNEEMNAVVRERNEERYWPLWSTLAPNTATLALQHIFEKAREPLNKLASKIYLPVEIPERDRKEFTAEKRLKLTVWQGSTRITLPSSITGSEQYKLFEARMRALLLEPTRLVVARERRQDEERRLTRDVQLEERLLEEDEIDPDTFVKNAMDDQEEPEEIKTIFGGSRKIEKFRNVRILPRDEIEVSKNPTRRLNGMNLDMSLLHEIFPDTVNDSVTRNKRICDAVDEVLNKTRKRARVSPEIEEVEEEPEEEYSYLMEMVKPGDETNPLECPENILQDVKSAKKRGRKPKAQQKNGTASREQLQLGQGVEARQQPEDSAEHGLRTGQQVVYDQQQHIMLEMVLDININKENRKLPSMVIHNLKTVLNIGSNKQNRKLPPTDREEKIAPYGKPYAGNDAEPQLQQGEHEQYEEALIKFEVEEEEMNVDPTPFFSPARDSEDDDVVLLDGQTAEELHRQLEEEQQNDMDH
ncbi:unnamed protein product [Caenorhabditis auriculariae]|uniref:snRNA-activating protein complex subunit 4 n=1 Tax=Caenorhabditis auriculariae TaxID=2777116 RepID=A0A8S1GPU1_9PELO|nr:unnamed protein product [Caenorhabditis auriculariae]